MKTAFEKEGLTVLSDPFYVVLGERVVFIDLELSWPQNSKQESLIAIEIKCFSDLAIATRELYISIGQYLLYRTGVKRIGLSHDVYLAIPKRIFEAIFDELVFAILEESKINTVVVNLDTAEVVEWIKY